MRGIVAAVLAVLLPGAAYAELFPGGYADGVVGNLGATAFYAPSGSVATLGPKAIVLGPNGDISYPLAATKIENGGLYVFRPVPSGPNGMGMAFSVVAGAADGAIVPGGAPWGTNGNTTEALSLLASYGSLDSVAAYLGNFSAASDYTVSSGIVCSVSSNYPSNQCTRLTRSGGSHFDPSKLAVNKGIFTNTTPRLASLIADFDPAGVWIDVPGWTQNNNPNPNPVPNLTNYDAGDAGSFPRAGGSLGVSIGVWNSQFGLNIQCFLSASPNIQPWATRCLNEFDMVNNTASYNPGTGLPLVDGLDIVGMGTHQSAHGLRIGGLNGLTNAPYTAIQIDNFGAVGIQLNQAAAFGGVGLGIVMQNGVPINVNNGSGNTFQVSANGNVVSTGDLTGSSIGYKFRVDHSAVPATVTSGGTYAFGNPQESVYLASSGTLSSLTVKLPPALSNGQHAYMTFQQQVTSLSVQDSTGSISDVAGGPGAIGATFTTLGFKWFDPPGAWIRIQ